MTDAQCSNSYSLHNLLHNVMLSWFTLLRVLLLLSMRLRRLLLLFQSALQQFPQLVLLHQMPVAPGEQVCTALAWPLHAHLGGKSSHSLERKSEDATTLQLAVNKAPLSRQRFGTHWYQGLLRHFPVLLQGSAPPASARCLRISPGCPVLYTLVFVPVFVSIVRACIPNSEVSSDHGKARCHSRTISALLSQQKQ